jgi:hypothetical protein
LRFIRQARPELERRWTDRAALTNNGVSVHFASAGLDTADPDFRKNRTFMSQMDGFLPKGQSVVDLARHVALQL